MSHVKADAASEPAVVDIVNQALNEEGHLDFFFANAGISQLRPKADANVRLAGLVQLGRKTGEIPHEEFTEIMRINALRWVSTLIVPGLTPSVFLAIKHAAPALAKVAPSKGKTVPGGSLVLTASSGLPTDYTR